MSFQIGLFNKFTGTLYTFISLLLWLITEYLTVWHAKFYEWLSLIPYAGLQYLFIILLFTYLFFGRKLSEKDVFVAMLIVMYCFEFLWENPLLLSVSWFVPASLLLISIWGFLTFIPFWIVEGNLSQRKLQTVYCLSWIPFGFFLSLM